MSSQKHKETSESIIKIIEQVKSQIAKFYKDFRSKFESKSPLFNSAEYMDLYANLKTVYAEVVHPKDANDPLKHLYDLKAEVNKGIPLDHLSTCIENAEKIKKQNVCSSWASSGYFVSIFRRN